MSSVHAMLYCSIDATHIMHSCKRFIFVTFASFSVNLLVIHDKFTVNLPIQRMRPEWVPLAVSPCCCFLLFLFIL